MENNILARKCIYLFCQVVDNFGDAGVAWRLSRILATEMGCSVVLLIDDLRPLAMLCPQVKMGLSEQWVDGVHLLVWNQQTDFRLPEKPDCVLELFACTLPENMQQMIAKQDALWLNWEYLTAESWALELHGLPSLQANGAQKYIYFMGFDAHSGGLLREQNYREQQAIFSGSLKAQYAFRHRLALPEKSNRKILLIFSYPSDIYPKWLSAMAAVATEPWEVWLAGGNQTWAREMAEHHDVIFREIPFVPQADFDHLLALCDLAVVRGEDSFVRAQYATLPFFWHIYPQEEHAHWHKLSAFWQHFPFANASLAQAHQALSWELNGGVPLSEQARQSHWQTLLEGLPEWQKSLQEWQKYLFSQPSACEKLAYFWQKRLK